MAAGGRERECVCAGFISLFTPLPKYDQPKAPFKLFKVSNLHRSERESGPCCGPGSDPSHLSLRALLHLSHGAFAAPTSGT